MPPRIRTIWRHSFTALARMCHISKFNPKIYDYSLKCEFAHFDPHTQKLDGSCKFWICSDLSYSGTIRALNGYTTENNSKPHCRKVPLCLVCFFLFCSRETFKKKYTPPPLPSPITQKKSGWLYKGVVSWLPLPQGMGRLYQGNHLVFKGRFREGQVELRDLVRQINDDKKVMYWSRKLGGCFFEPDRLRAVCMRGKLTSLSLSLSLNTQYSSLQEGWSARGSEN